MKGCRDKKMNVVALPQAVSTDETLLHITGATGCKWRRILCRLSTAQEKFERNRKVNTYTT